MFEPFDVAESAGMEETPSVDALAGGSRVLALA